MEIGSEFWSEFRLDNINYNLQAPKWLQLGQDYKLVLSGRTAIDFIIKDIKFRSNVKLAYLPSYCCNSMVKPFLDNGITVDFYNVKYSEEDGFKYDIDYKKSPDIFLSMNYYGFTKSEMKFHMEDFKNRNIIVIEDITHSILNSGKSCANYGVASIRKWMAIPSGAIAINYNDKFIESSAKLKGNDEYINSKLNAMKLKAEYMETGNEEIKPIFLEKFTKLNNLLSNEYKEFKIDDISLSILNSIDINKIKEKRKANADYIYTNLKETNDIRFVYSRNLTDICPLFVPVRINRDKRDDLRKHLVSNSIYSPIHWNYYPESFKSEDLKYINQTILSLVCDQRYGDKEMEYMVSMINDFMSV